MNKLKEIQYYNNRLPGKLDDNLLFYFSFDTGNSIINPVSGKLGSNQSYLFSGEILPNVGNFWFNSGYGYINNNYIKVNNTNNLINFQDFTFICVYENIAKTGATLLSTVSRLPIESYDEFGVPYNDLVYAGFEFGFTANSRLFFEFYDSDGPKVFISDFDLTDKSSVFLNVSNQNVALGYYNFIENRIISNNFNFNSRFIFSPTGLFIGANPDSSSFYNYNKQFEGLIEQTFLCSPKIYQYEVENINKAFVSSYIPESNFYNETLLTGIIGESINIDSFWVMKQKLTGDTVDDRFGTSVATNSDGTLLIMGGINDDAGGANAGAALVYTGNSVAGWQLRQKLTGDSAGDQFGSSVATNSDGTLLMMGGRFDNAGGTDAGAALIYTGSATAGWGFKQKLVGDSAGDRFGESVATNSDGTLLMMGGVLDDDGGNNAGAALVYTGNSIIGWQLRQKLTGDSAGDQFGSDVATNNDGTVLIMGGTNDSNAGGVFAGAALVYTGSAIVGWQLRQKLTGDSIGDQFGRSVATNSDGTILIIGGIGDADGGNDAGAALVYTGNSIVGWQLRQKLTGDSPIDYFGTSVASNSDGTILTMGGNFDDDGGSNAGAAIIYTGNATAGWQLKQKLIGDSAGDQFGWSVATNADGTILMMGGIGDQDGGSNAGAALVYNLNSITNINPITGFLYGITGYTTGILGIDTGIVTGIEFIETGTYEDEFGNIEIGYEEVQLFGDVTITGFIPLSGILKLIDSGIINENISGDNQRISEFGKNTLNLLSKIDSEDLIEIQTITGNYNNNLLKNITSFYDNVGQNYIFTDIKSASDNFNYTLFANGLLTTSGSRIEVGNVYSSRTFISGGDFISTARGEFLFEGFDETHSVFGDFITGDIIVENNFSKNNSGILNTTNLKSYNVYFNGQKLTENVHYLFQSSSLDFSLFFNIFGDAMSGKMILLPKNFNDGVTGFENLYNMNKFYNNFSQVYRNGIRQRLNFDYLENGIFTLNNGSVILDIKNNSIYNNDKLFN